MIYDKQMLRLIDANLNRLKEGIRVVEDICRFILDNKDLCKSLKSLRHNIKKAADSTGLTQGNLLDSRDIKNDTGAENFLKQEEERRGLEDIFAANMKRMQESARVLEEFLKLDTSEKKISFKNIRYEIYNLEKEIFKVLNKYLKGESQ